MSKLVINLGLVFASIFGVACSQIPKQFDLNNTLANSEHVKQQAKSAAEQTHIEKALVKEAAITEQPLTGGNKVDILIDGPEAYEAMFNAMRKAKHHIHMETYIFADDDLGKQLANILIERRLRGVEIRVIYDSIGSMVADTEFFKRMADIGIELYEFNKFDALSLPVVWEINRRHHRKILIVDGKIGFTGGMNVSSVYSSSAFGSLPEHKTNFAWRDTHVKVTGPSVHNMQKIFLKAWQVDENPQAAALPSEPKQYFPAADNVGTSFVRVVTNYGYDNDFDIYSVVLNAIENANTSIMITQAYFSPNDDILVALKDAAKRGVNVELMLPAFSDSWLVYHASRSHYADLLEAGITIYERKSALLHAKTIVIDKEWVTIGSSNMDVRSFLHNREANIVVVGGNAGEVMADIFMLDIDFSQKIALKEWDQRPLDERLLEGLSHLFNYWL